MNEKVIETIHVCIALLASAILCAICVNLCIHANLGSDSITVFEDGLHHAFGITVGMGSYLYNGGVIVLALLIARKNIGWTTIAFALMEGKTIDVMDQIMTPMFANPTNLVVRWFYVFMAIICLGASIALLVLYRKGMDGLDAICYGINERFHIDYRIVRTTADAILLITGFLMGGTVGLGSIPAVLLTGVSAHSFVSLFNKIGLGAQTQQLITEKG